MNNQGDLMKHSNDSFGLHITIPIIDLITGVTTITVTNSIIRFNRLIYLIVQ